MESINIIQCPHCSHLIEPWDFMDIGDMEGEFEMDCEECGKSFKVDFETDIRFKTSEC